VHHRAALSSGCSARASVPGGVSVARVVLRVGWRETPAVHGPSVSVRRPALADGRRHHEPRRYDPFGRLSGFEVDSPPGRFAFAFTPCSARRSSPPEHGAYTRTERGLDPVRAGFGAICASSRRAAQRTLAVTRRARNSLVAATSDRASPSSGSPRRTSTAPYNVEDWRRRIDLGSSRAMRGFARVRVTGDRPTVETVWPSGRRSEAGSRCSWLDGHVGFSVDNQISASWRPTAASSRRAVRARLSRTGLTSRPPHPRRLGTRLDHRHGSVQSWPASAAIGGNFRRGRSAGFQPYYFTCESNGVVWMHSDRRLARLIRRCRPAPSHCLFTHSSRPEFFKQRTHGVLPSGGTAADRIDDGSFACISSRQTARSVCRSISSEAGGGGLALGRGGRPPGHRFQPLKEALCFARATARAGETGEEADARVTSCRLVPGRRGLRPAT